MLLQIAQNKLTNFQKKNSNRKYYSIDFTHLYVLFNYEYIKGYIVHFNFMIKNILLYKSEKKYF